MTTKAPETIWAETTPYDFPGYSPAWVWHHPESLEDGSEGLERYVRVDIHAAVVAERDELAAKLRRLQNDN